MHNAYSYVETNEYVAEGSITEEWHRPALRP